jgi:hypothetical protein
MHKFCFTPAHVRSYRCTSSDSRQHYLGIITAHPSIRAFIIVFLEFVLEIVYRSKPEEEKKVGARSPCTLILEYICNYFNPCSRGKMLCWV